MLHTDIPSRSEVERLLAVRDPACVSIYVPASPLTHEAQATRIELKTLAAQARDQLKDAGHGAAATVHGALEDLVDDDDFWAVQAHSLAVLAAPGTLRTFRLPNRLTSHVEVGDRFYVKPLLRAITFPQAAFVLALAAGSVRLVEVTREGAPFTVDVPGLPADAASAAGKASIYRSRNSYPHLVAAGIDGNPEAVSDQELAAAARPVLDHLYASELSNVRDRFELASTRDRASTDVATVARAATYGAVDVLVVDIDDKVPGHVDEETGAVTFAGDDAASYGVVDEAARRTLLSGGRVLAVRRDDVPGGGPVAAILRHPL